MKTITVFSIPALKDNYIHVIKSANSPHVLIVDPSEAQPVCDFLTQHNLTPDGVIITHHHHDHVGGNLELKQKFNIPIFCSEYDFARVPGATHRLADNSTWQWHDQNVRIYATPGHTLGAICFHFTDAGLLFTGDTLFTLGCGRLFEGTATQLYSSFQRIKHLPPTTQVYCGHEYGLQNQAFAQFIAKTATDLYSPAQIEALSSWAQHFKSRGSQSVPSQLSDELALNPFLKARNPAEFGRFRLLKDEFRLEDHNAIG